MEFLRLRIAGFKSFVDPAEFHIEPGLTGIVGPNGCGKSNVLESLRWVMGANSAKAMRGQGMDDVIFAGASGRPSRNHAEVLLTIDNARRRAPQPFTDAPLLEVSRRIDRGQGSTYKVNGKEVRARDVQLLFADASTGANSPALVRQGQISELIAAKPQNRRRILEEAGGVAGLHTRRHEAELRLRAAETNLDRLDDISRELETTLARLKREARQAEKYKKISAEIRALQARPALCALERRPRGGRGGARPNWPRRIRRWPRPRADATRAQTAALAAQEALKPAARGRRCGRRPAAPRHAGTGPAGHGRTGRARGDRAHHRRSGAHRRRRRARRGRRRGRGAASWRGWPPSWRPCRPRSPPRPSEGRSWRPR